MFKKKPTKAELRHQLQAEVSTFLENGGAIQEVEMGASGLVDGKYSSLKSSFEKAPVQARTPIHSLLSAIDQRRKQAKQPATLKPQKRARKKIIYDDFGEPIRTVWLED